MKVDLRGNIKSIGSTYITLSSTPLRALRQSSFVTESEPPWRQGHGRGLLVVPGWLLSVGTWRPAVAEGTNPWDDDELGDVHEDIADTINIRKWPDDAHDNHAPRRLASR